MAEPDPPPRKFPSPLALLLVLGGLLVATAAWSYFFRRTEVPRPVDALLGTLIEVRFDADPPWKRGFAPAKSTIRVEGVLRATVEQATDEGPRRVLRLRILDRGGQDPYVLTDFRWGILRGSTVVLQDGTSMVNAEVVAVEPAKKP